ncbi:chloroquine resistance marker protein, putative [Plasmodium gallinaceum]|uniref:Chloroquine resistance marker protein, putative n=1 Tax=Plasmodium gallinaceum TaxID=5849 RepID=A0A1J1GUF9_PLAGA|nr:chloroquine resistance marker protein, putative [Plasmodium gallinaceum]CRG94681.1 chloroquine resistance marker protein, putative [Plasmodium gallinaceum]
MNEIYYYSEEIDNLLEDYRKLLNDLQNESCEEKTNKYCNDINFITERIKTTKDAYFIEVRNLPEKDQNNHILKIKGKMSILENLNLEFDFIKSKLRYEKNEEKKNKIVKEKYLTPKEIEIRGDLIQDHTNESIYRMKKMVDESEQITIDAINKLNVQNEKLQEVTDNVDDVEMNISHAKQTLREIAKEAITDRFVRLLALLIFIVLIVLIAIIAIPRKK